MRVFPKQGYIKYWYHIEYYMKFDTFVLMEKGC